MEEKEKGLVGGDCVCCWWWGGYEDLMMRRNRGSGFGFGAEMEEFYGGCHCCDSCHC